MFGEALAAHKEGRLAEAATGYEAVLQRDPGHLKAAVNLGLVLKDLGRFEEAEACLKRAGRDPVALFNLGNLCRLQQRLEEAEAAYLSALALAPDYLAAKLNLGQVYLALGRYAEGWPLFELREERANTPARKLPNPEWVGEPIAGKTLLVGAEQGFGDQIQMARFIPVLRAIGADVRLAPLPGLRRLFAQLAPLEIGAPDYWMLPMSAPARLALTLETLPTAPYLAAPQEAREQWRGFARGGIAMVWHGNPVQAVERYRGLPSPAMLDGLKSFGPVYDLQEPRGDFADTAAIVEQLDLIVTTDTAMAHLAGAMGKPCFVLLPFLGLDWRWMRERPDTPWYPGTRLFRQERPGDWSTPIARLIAAAGEFRRS